MRRTRSLLPLALLLVPSVRADDAHVLVAEDDVLANGDTVREVRWFDVRDDGAWAAVVETDRPGVISTHGEVLVRDGVPVLATGDVLSNGSTVTYVREVHLDPIGALLVRLETQLPGGGVEQAVLLNGSLAVEEGPVAAPGLPPGSEIVQIFDAKIAGRDVLVHADLDQVGGPNAVLRYTFPPGGGAPAIELVALSTGPLAPLPWPTVGASVIDIAADGGVGLAASTLSVAPYALAVWVDGAVPMISGDPGPLPGTTWNPVLFPNVSVASGGRYAFSSAVELTASGAQRGIVMHDGALVAREGGAVPGFPFLSFAPFELVGIDLSESGALWAVLPVDTPNPNHVLLAGGEVVLRSGVSTASGQVIDAIDDEWRRVRTSSDGRRCLVAADLADGRNVLLSVESAVGGPLPCAVVPNSTGVIGRLRASGSSYVAANDLRVTAYDLPADSFGYLNTSLTSGFTPNPGGSVGNLCLGGAIGRFVGQVASSGAAGEIETVVDLAAVPQPTGPVAAAAGEIWHFQLWHRDASPGGAVSNWTQGMRVVLR